MTSPRAALAVFAREPVAGRVKTRLARAIGPHRACAVYSDLLRATLAAAAAVAVARFLFLPAGDRLSADEHPVGAFAPRAQRGADLGARMDGAFGELFAGGYERVVLIGSDCPYLTGELLTEAFARLRERETVFGPTRDGGYYLVGQTAPARDLFAHIPWSTAAVWPLTRQRLADHGWTCALLPELEDIDDLASLERYQGSR